MPDRLPIPSIEWRDGQLWSRDYEDGFASAHGARAEREHVFLRAHGFACAQDAEPGRWSAQPRFTFGELGFGAGLSFLVTWAAFRTHVLPRDSRATLEWIGVEGAPLDAKHLVRAALADPATTSDARTTLRRLAGELALAWPERIPGLHRRTLDGGRVKLTLLFGDVLELLPRVSFCADAWNLDGFAPARNAAMWSNAVMRELAMHSRRGTTAATYSAASAVRASLERAGFAVELRAGAGAKREMTLATWERDAPAAPERVLPGTVTVASPAPHAHSHTLPAWFAQPAPCADAWQRPAIVIGAGLAGAAAARALAERGIEVHVHEAATVASAASGAPRAILAPHLASWHGIQARAVAHAFLHARAELERLSIPHDQCGLLHPLSPDDEWAHHAALDEWGWPADQLCILSPERAERLAGTSLGGRSAIHLPLACATAPADIVRALLNHPFIAVHEHSPLTAAQATKSGGVVILATARAELPEIPFDGTRGQLTLLRADGSDTSRVGASQPGTILLGAGFAIPPHGGTVCIGATHDRDDDSLAPSTRSDAQNLAQLERVAPALALAGQQPNARAGAWVGMRATLNDHLPVVGAVPDAAEFASAFARLNDGPFAAKWPPAPLQRGLYCSLAHGSRGTSTALLAGELLADIVTGSVRCVTDDLLPALLPQRFLVRALRRGDSKP